MSAVKTTSQSTLSETCTLLLQASAIVSSMTTGMVELTIHPLVANSVTLNACGPGLSSPQLILTADPFVGPTKLPPEDNPQM